MDLLEAVFTFDGRHVGPLQAILDGGLTESDISNLVDWCGNESENEVVAASWLIRGHLENGGALSAAQLRAFCAASAKFSHWGAQLHFLQSVQFLDPALHSDEMLAIARELQTSKRTLVAVWAFDATVRLLVSGGDLREAKALVAASADHKAASYRARGRNLVQSFPELG